MVTVKYAALLFATAIVNGEWTLRSKRAQQFIFVAAFLSSLPSIGGCKSINHCKSQGQGERALDKGKDSCAAAGQLSEQCVIAQNGDDRVNVYGAENVHWLYDDALDVFIRVVRDNPRAVILFPTGSTAKPFYKKIIAAFEADPKLDLLGIAAFNLDEYVGLPADHPLSYHYYMERNLYAPLQSIDSNRAPQKSNIHIPTPGDNPEESIRAYGELLRETMDSRGGLDLAILGVGGAYPVRNEDGSVDIKGGHIAFNEPGGCASQTAHLVTLTEKTRGDTAHRFKSLANLIRSGVLDASLSSKVPTHALTLGLGDILQADKIMVLALGEEKAPALEKAFSLPGNSDVPASHLVGNSKVLWLLDESAAATLPDFVQTQDYYIPTGKLSETMKEAVAKTDQLFPKGENVLILSPHPDDDVISMGAAIEHLHRRGCAVHVAYAVTGANAVRPEGDMFEKVVEQVLEALGTELTSANDLYPTIDTRAKAWVRRQEALRATALLHVPSENLHFLECEYYDRRGIEGVEALTDNDLKKMMNAIALSSAHHIFFAAEDDPHGAHGLSTKLLVKALKEMPDFKVTLWGYRGAYSEWSLRESKHLSIIPFDQDLMDLKIRAIKSHASQLNPLYPSFDPREFYERATDRNRAFAQRVSKVIGHTLSTMEMGDQRPAYYAEAFRRYSKEEFIRSFIG